MALAEGTEGRSIKRQIAAGHATAIAKRDEAAEGERGTSRTRARRSGRQQQLAANVHIDRGVSPQKVKTLLQRAARMTSSKALVGEEPEHPLVQDNQIQELNAIEAHMGREQRALELAAGPSVPLGTTGPASETLAASPLPPQATRGRRTAGASRRRRNAGSEALALKLAAGPSVPLGLTEPASEARLSRGLRGGRAAAAAGAGHVLNSAVGGHKDTHRDSESQVSADPTLAENRAALARKQARLKTLRARQRVAAAARAAAKAQQALRGLDVLAHTAQNALGDDMVSATAIRRGWLGL